MQKVNINSNMMHKYVHIHGPKYTVSLPMTSGHECYGKPASYLSFCCLFSTVVAVVVCTILRTRIKIGGLVDYVINSFPYCVKLLPRHQNVLP